MNARTRPRPAWLAIVAAALIGCRSTTRSAALGAPTHVDVGSGTPDAMARRAATEIADAPVLAERAPRVGELDRRFVVRLDRQHPVGSGTLCAFQSLFENALLGTGRFLLVDDPATPLVLVGVSGPLGRERMHVRVRGPGGEEWVDVGGALEPPN